MKKRLIFRIILPFFVLENVFLVKTKIQAKVFLLSFNEKIVTFFYKKGYR